MNGLLNVIMQVTSVSPTQVLGRAASASTQTLGIAGAEQKMTDAVQQDWKMLDVLRSWLVNHGVSDLYADTVKLLIVFGVIIVLALLADWVAKRIFLAIVAKVAAKTETIFDDILVQNKVFHRLANLAPAIVIFYAINVPLANYLSIKNFIHVSCELYIVIMILVTILAFIKSVNEMYLTLPVAKTRSIKGYLQVVKIILYIITVLVCISIIWNLDLTKLFTGLGAMAAVLMFVFKDVILGLVASIQLSANDMLRPGDWIEMPSRKADGVVTDISLATVKVQNFDKTITTIPTYSIVSESFTNWRGMEESDGRRIKRSMHIDMKSVRFISDALLDKLTANKFIAKNFDVKQYMANNDNYLSGQDTEHRTETNLGLFRSYLETYLKSLPIVNPDMTLLVRYQQSTENGLPLEVVVFSRRKDGKGYEKVQSEIFDHILAMLPEFELKVFQRQTTD